MEFPTSSQRIRRTLSEKQAPIRIIYTSIAILDDDFRQRVDGFWNPSKLDFPVLHIGNTFLSNLVQKITNILHPSWESIHHKLIILPADTINRIQILLNVSHHRVYLSLTVGESFHHISSLLLGILSLLQDMVVTFIFLQFEGLNNTLKVFVNLFDLLTIEFLRTDQDLTNLCTILIYFFTILC